MKRVVVIGGGIVGLCAAESLARRGDLVTILEADPTPGNGCSYGNGGLVVPSHFEPLSAPGVIGMALRMLLTRRSAFGFQGFPGLEMAAWMMRFGLAANAARAARSAPLLKDLHAKSQQLFETAYPGMDFGFQKTGSLMVCQTAARLEGEKRLASEAQHLGLRAQVLSADDIARLEPNIQMDVLGGVYFEDDSFITPPLFMDQLRAKIIANGVDVRDGVTVDAFTQAGDRVTAVNDIPCDEVVIAAGAWSGILARKLGHRLPMAAGKGYGFTLAEPAVSPIHAAILIEGRVAVTPMENGLRFVGTMELGHPAPMTVNPNRLKGMQEAIESAYPGYRGTDWSMVTPWAGLRPCSPDGVPYIGRLGSRSNVTVAAGHAMIGLSLGPITGELVAEIIHGDAPSVPLELLSPNRYA